MTDKTKKPDEGKEQVYLVPVTWHMTGHYAIKARSVDEAVKKSVNLPLPEEGSYLDASFEAFEDEVAPITKEFAHLPVRG